MEELPEKSAQNLTNGDEPHRQTKLWWIEKPAFPILITLKHWARYFSKLFGAPKFWIWQAPPV